MFWTVVATLFIIGAVSGLINSAIEAARKPATKIGAAGYHVRDANEGADKLRAFLDASGMKSFSVSRRVDFGGNYVICLDVPKGSFLVQGKNIEGDLAIALGKKIAEKFKQASGYDVDVRWYTGWTE